MEKFRCLRLSILAEAEDYIRLPDYQGGALRGAFGHAFKKAACTMKDQECLECILKNRCIYSYAFETPPPEDAEVLRLYPYAPHPFTINPMSNNAEGSHHPGSQLQFGMTLIGRAIEYLPYFVYGFIQMGCAGIGKGRGRFHVSRVTALDASGEKRETVYQENKIKSPKTILLFEDADRSTESYRSNEVALKFKSPIRVKYNGRLHDKPEFHIIMRNLLRRLSNLLYFHCDQRVDLPFKEIIQKAETVEIVNNQTRWYDWSRYSGRQNKQMKMGGIVGEASYKGDLADFLPMLVMGTWVNIGKGTSFGLGSYTLS